MTKAPTFIRAGRRLINLEAVSHFSREHVGAVTAHFVGVGAVSGGYVTLDGPDAEELERGLRALGLFVPTLKETPARV